MPKVVAGESEGPSMSAVLQGVDAALQDACARGHDKEAYGGQPLEAVQASLLARGERAKAAVLPLLLTAADDSVVELARSGAKGEELRRACEALARYVSIAPVQRGLGFLLRGAPAA